MEYIVAIYKDEKRWEAMSPAERDEVWDACDRYGQELIKSGHFRSGAPLVACRHAQTVRLSEGRHIVSDGPFAETKEVLAGYHVIECKNRDEAVAIAKRFPGLRVGMSAEVRAVGQD